MGSDGWMNHDKAETMAPLPCCLVQAMSFFIYVEHDNGQTTQSTEKYLGFCQMKTADFLLHILAFIIDYEVSMNI